MKTRITTMLVALVMVLSMTTTAFAAQTVPPVDPMASVTELPQNPVTEEAFQTVFLYAAKNALTSVTVSYSLPYQDSYKAEITSLLGKTLNGFTYRYPEYFNYLRKVAFTTVKEANGFSIVLTFNSKAGVEDTEAMLSRRATADAKVLGAYNNLRTSGALKDGMTEKQRARAILDWVCANVAYKDDNTLISHTAYGALVNGTAVCDGYSSLYQSLLRLDGIRCWGQKGNAVANNECHHWTVAILDGVQVNIDASWSDSPKSGDTYFAVSDDAFRLTHKW